MSEELVAGAEGSAAMRAFIFVDWRRSAGTVVSASSSGSSQLLRHMYQWNGNVRGSPPIHVAIESALRMRSKRHGGAAKEGKDRPCSYDDAEDCRSGHGGGKCSVDADGLIRTWEGLETGCSVHQAAEPMLAMVAQIM
mmetsp:Transcript_24736/g.71421  ORF Transcript_24736/g.71421 Transcript_24736/m.71421 type:complete len:138 (+) Transcript_24736:2258-2671(+)